MNPSALRTIVNSSKTILLLQQNGNYFKLAKFLPTRTNNKSKIAFTVITSMGIASFGLINKKRVYAQDVQR